MTSDSDNRAVILADPGVILERVEDKSARVVEIISTEGSFFVPLEELSSRNTFYICLLSHHDSREPLQIEVSYESVESLVDSGADFFITGINHYQGALQ